MPKLQKYNVDLKNGSYTFSCWIKSQNPVDIFIKLNLKSTWDNDEKLNFSCIKKFRSSETWSYLEYIFDIVFPGKYEIKVIAKDQVIFGNGMFFSPCVVLGSSPSDFKENNEVKNCQKFYDDYYKRKKKDIFNPIV